MCNLLPAGERNCATPERVGLLFFSSAEVSFRTIAPYVQQAFFKPQGLFTKANDEQLIVH